MIQYFCVRGEGEMKKYTRDEIETQSVILIGPVGSGKSLISQKLSKETSMPVITTDLLRHCPKTIEEIDKKYENCLNRIEQTQIETKSAKKVSEYEKLKRRMDDLFLDCEILKNQRELRELLPNVSNYSDYGWNRDVSKYVMDRFGMVAWHFYQKQFENQLLQELISKLDRPCIIDMGGGMSISLDKDYHKLAEQFKEINEDLFRQYFDLSKIGFSQIKTMLKPFSNIVELKLPYDYKKTMLKAKNDKLNPKFISSGQNRKLATSVVSVKGILQDGRPNDQVVNKIVKDIINKKNENMYIGKVKE